MTHMGRIGRFHLAACAALAATSAGALTNDEVFNYRDADRQKVLEEGARKEGTVVLYSAMIVNQAQRPLAEAFRKKYPFIDIKYWRGDDNQIVQKVIAEARAKQPVADVVEGSGASGGMDEAGIPAAFYSAYSDVMPKDAQDPARKWITTRYRYIALGYNTKLVKKEDAPKTYDDLLDPKWKDKLAWSMGSTASGALIVITSLRAAWGDQKAGEYLEKLAKQNVSSLTMSNRAVVDRMIEGEVQVGIGFSAHHPIISARKGAPSDTVMLDPTPALNDAVHVVAAAKHPHAAMLLVDFMLSPETQTLLQEAEYFPSNPNVDPADTLKRIVPKNSGVPAVMITPELLLRETPNSMKVYESLFRK